MNILNKNKNKMEDWNGMETNSNGNNIEYKRNETDRAACQRFHFDKVKFI